MEPSFWHERWAKDEIGFHQDEYNSHMQAFIERLDLQPGAHIMVPLCGKSLDLLWLLEQGYRVSGIELSRQAVEDFFAENQLETSIDEIESGQRFSHGDLNLYCADFFEFDFASIAPLDAIYDRAALVALPPEMRKRYSKLIDSICPPGIRMLLVTLDYPQEEMRGPPFSVPGEEVKQLFGQGFRLEHVYFEDCLVNEPRFRKKGLTRMDEHVFLLEKSTMPPCGDSEHDE